MNPDPLPIVVLNGFLGSGKTTLLRKWRRAPACANAALIVHDLSEFGLDAELLADESNPPVLGELHGRLAALHGRHAGDDLAPSLARALDGISQLDPPPPLVFLESTGAARPWPLLRALAEDPRFQIRHWIVTVDALNLHRDFRDGKAFTGESAPPDDPALARAMLVLAEQLAFASVILLTKTDLLSHALVTEMAETLGHLAPGAAIGLSARGGLDLSELELLAPPDLQAARERARRFGLAESGSTTATGLEAMVIRDPRPFHPQRLFEVCQTQLATGLFRTKGFLWLASRPGDVLLWQQSGSQISLELTGIWRAELVRNRDGKLFPDEVAVLRERLDREHPIFGDRHAELTLIGYPEARDAFAEALHSAFCTPEEIAQWQEGRPFEDPWPTNLQVST